jgi:5-methylcytosine-specific restriction endonuclease McrA
VFDMIRSHELSIGIAALIEPILTDENKDDILGRVRGATNREVGRVVSEYRPPVALRDRLDYVRVPAPRPRNLDTFLSERECARVAPLAWQQHMPTEEKVFVQFLADEEFLTLFEEVQKLRSNTDRSFADVMKSALKMYRDQISPVARKARRDKKKAAKEARADARKRVISPDSQRWESNDAAQSRHIPDELRDEVHVRDAGKCMFVAADGTRCESTHDVEVDHVNPFSSGGIHDSANLRLLCGPHNRLVAEQVLGKHVMDPFWRRQ